MARAPYWKTTKMFAGPCVLAVLLSGCGAGHDASTAVHTPQRAPLFSATDVDVTTPSQPHTSPTLVTSSYKLGSTQGPNLALTGPATLVGTSEPDGLNLVRAFTSGSSRVIAHAGFRDENDSMLFSASPTRIAMLDTGPHTEGNVEQTVQVLQSGPLGGALQTLPAECPSAVSIDEFVPTHTNVAVDGEVVAYDT